MPSRSAQPAAPAPAGAPPPGPFVLFRAGLALGLVGFGGGLCALSLVRSKLVEKKGWLSAESFDQAALVGQMLPGGASANTLAYVGLRLGGPMGALLSYVGFLIPGVLAILGLGAAYVRLGSVPHAAFLLRGISAAVVGIIGALALSMVRTSAPRRWQMLVAVGALVLGSVGGLSSAAVALLGIASGLLLEPEFGLPRRIAHSLKRRTARGGAAPAARTLAHHSFRTAGQRPARLGAREPSGAQLVPDTAVHHSMMVLVVVGAGLSAHALGPKVVELAEVFARQGLGAFGGGFAIIPALQAKVLHHGWMSARQFADAVAVGKLTPGPVLLMATFIGYVRAGLLGGLVSTLAIFAGPFLLVLALGRWLDRARRHAWVRAALAGLAPAVVGLIAAAALTLGRSLQGGVGLALAGLAAVALLRFRLNPVLLLGLAGAASLGLHAVGV